MFRPLAVILSLVSIASALSAAPLDTSRRLIISVRDQKLMLLENGGKVATYPVSTSKFGLGDLWGRMTTPLGYLMVAKKIGDMYENVLVERRCFLGILLQIFGILMIALDIVK